VVEYGSTHPSDITAIAALFQSAFPEALLAVFDKPQIPPKAVEDIFQLIYRFEPQGFVLAQDQGRPIGFIVMVHDLQRLHHYALWSGGLFSMVGNWVTGRYRGLGFAFLPRLLKAWWNYRSADTRPIPEKPMGQVISIVVDKAYRGQGIGKALSERALAYLRTTAARVVRLEVDAAKPVPIALYKQLGFREHATIPSPRGPALVMVLQLK
jgi:ribosomal protein S18 acetylase RimI-like enzyme